MKHKAFLKNAAILTITSLILRTVGIFFRIWMSNTIGAEGMGLYQLIISVYVLASTFATTGICTAVTRMVSELAATGKSASKIMRRAVEMTLILSAITALLLYFAADPVAEYLVCDMRAARAIKILIVGLPFMGISSCIRGYFIAVHNTAFPSISQLLEQLVRIGLIMYLVGMFASKGLEYTCAAIIIGDTAAEFAGCLLLYILYLWERKNVKGKESGIRVTHKMLHIAVPITVGRYIHTILRTGENLLVPSRLARFTGQRESSLEQFGMLKGMAMPLLFFPASFLMAFSTLMIPEISEALANNHIGKVRTATEKSIGVTVIVSTLIGGMFFLCGGDIAVLLYSSKDTGFLISALAPLVPFMYLESVCDGILKGLDQQGHSFVYGVIDSVTRIVLIWFVVGKYGMYGFILIMVYSNLLTSILNVRRLLKVTETKVKIFSWIIKPVFCIIAAGTLGYFAMHSGASPIIRTALGCGTTATVYFLLMFFLGELNILDGIF